MDRFLIVDNRRILQLIPYLILGCVFSFVIGTLLGFGILRDVDALFDRLLDAAVGISVLLVLRQSIAERFVGYDRFVDPAYEVPNTLLFGAAVLWMAPSLYSGLIALWNDAVLRLHADILAIPSPHIALSLSLGLAAYLLCVFIPVMDEEY